jgi:molybdopterin biosynthesis enzyme MoaB
VAVTRGKTLIVNLPGSPKAVEEGLAVLLPLVGHIAELLAGPVEH